MEEELTDCVEPTGEVAETADVDEADRKVGNETEAGIRDGAEDRVESGWCIGDDAAITNVHAVQEVCRKDVRFADGCHLALGDIAGNLLVEGVRSGERAAVPEVGASQLVLLPKARDRREW